MTTTQYRHHFRCGFTTLTFLLVFFALTPAEAPTYLHAASGRSFYMGFTPLPPDYSGKGLGDIYSFIQANSDLIAQHIESGVPWQQMLDGSALPAAVFANWSDRLSRTPSSAAMYTAITPLNGQRTGLGLRWETEENQPLSGGWETKRLNNPDVKLAYLNYAKRVVDFFHPRFLAVGIEANRLLIQKPDLWSDYKELNRYVYTEIKKAHPELVVFTTIQYEDFREPSDNNPALERQEVAAILQSSDILALSTYKLADQWNPRSDSYFGAALTFGKPIAIAEMGASSRNATIAGYATTSSEATQDAFVNMVLNAAAQDRFLFVVNFVGIDYDALLAKLPTASQEGAGYWVSTGLERGDGSQKPALVSWKKILKMPRS